MIEYAKHKQKVCMGWLWTYDCDECGKEFETEWRLRIPICVSCRIKQLDLLEEDSTDEEEK